MTLFRILFYLAMAFMALFVLRRILMMVRGGISVNDMNELKAKGAVIIDVRTPTTLEFSRVWPAPVPRAGGNIPLDHWLAQRMNELEVRTSYPEGLPIIRLLCTPVPAVPVPKRFLQREESTETRSNPVLLPPDRVVNGLIPFVFSLGGIGGVRAGRQPAARPGAGSLPRPPANTADCRWG
ncbi:MAG: hypothetical protein IPN59_01335 [Holophaga sp.]|nr:hypothetical protein [Holophaga sp.]